jgi:hypothetical protein
VVLVVGIQRTAATAAQAAVLVVMVLERVERQRLVEMPVELRLVVDQAAVVVRAQLAVLVEMVLVATD